MKKLHNTQGKRTKRTPIKIKTRLRAGSKPPKPSDGVDPDLPQNISFDNE